MRALLVLALLIGSLAPAQAQWENRQGNIPTWGNGWTIDAVGLAVAVVGVRYDQGGYLWCTRDGGAHWDSLLQFSILETPFDVSMPDTSGLWVATDKRIFYWQASSDSWQQQYAPDTSETWGMDFVRMFDRQNGIAMGDAKNDSGPALFLRTTDGGAHWVSVNDSAFGGWSADNWRRMDFVSPAVGYFYESGINPNKLYKTNDGCAHWKALSFPDSLYIQVLTFHGEQLGLAYTIRYRIIDSTHVLHFNYIVRTRDGGTTWEVFPCPSTNWGNHFAFVPGNPAKVWMTEDVNLYLSADTGHTWTKVLAQGGREIVFTDSLHGWMPGDKGVLLYTANAGNPPTSVSQRPPEAGSGFALAQNYPNPFNPSTTIRYSLPHRAHVTLAVFNTLGQKVAEPINSEIEAGKHELSFDARNLASGLYFYRLQAGPYITTKTMAVVK